MQNQSEDRVYAGFFVRLIAFAIDSLLAALVVSTIKSPFAMASMSGIELFDANFIFHYSFLDVLDYVGVAAYFVLLTYYSHTTPGKMAMRLEVITLDKEWTLLNVIYRETIGRFFSSLMCVGYFAVLVTGKKQGFHDMLCDTYVVYKNMVPKMVTAPVVSMRKDIIVPATETEFVVKNPDTELAMQPEEIITETIISESVASADNVQAEQPKAAAPVYYTMSVQEGTDSRDSINTDGSDLSNLPSEEAE